MSQSQKTAVASEPYEHRPPKHMCVGIEIGSEEGEFGEFLVDEAHGGPGALSVEEGRLPPYSAEIKGAWYQSHESPGCIWIWHHGRWYYICY